MNNPAMRNAGKLISAMDLALTTRAVELGFDIKAIAVLLGRPVEQLMQRKYSPTEIDKMRATLTARITAERQKDCWPFAPGGVDMAVEEQLRTYMQNGTAPDELGG